MSSSKTANIFDNNFATTRRPTASEVEAFGEALKKPEFRAMLVDYVKEVSDPDNQRQYKAEMAALEAERGYHVTFLTPRPGYVLKTRVVSSLEADDNESIVSKVFVNVCSEENIGDASASAPASPDGRIPWALPYSTSKPRRDVDKAGGMCMVYDVLFHPNVIAKAEASFAFRDMVNATALEGIEKAFGLKLDRKRLRFPKLKFKGSVHTTVIRKEASKVKVKAEPKYNIKFRHNSRDLPTMNESDPCRPSEMVIEVSLPGLSSAAGIDLDVLEHVVTLESETYKLVLKLPYPVHDDQGSAKFDKAKHSLEITLPVKAKEAVARLISTDSGIGLDLEEAEIEEEKPQSLQEASIEVGLAIEQSLPPFTSHIYDGLMVFTINVRNVVADGLKTALLSSNKGFQLNFHSMGEGLMPFRYGFCLAFDVEEENFSLEDLEVEVWDNNMILQLSMPKGGCSSYKVGTCEATLGASLALPQLRAVKEKCYQLGKKEPELDSDDSLAETKSYDDKERHSSGESNDSAVSFAPLLEDEPFEVSSGTLRGILKRQRCFSESQKSVRFNEVVQRQVYRSNSSILGQKAKNLKKAEQKRRRAAEKRRLSEGDAGSFTMSSCPESDEEESTKNDDSGVASSLDERNQVKMTKSKKVVKKCNKNNQSTPPNNDLIFNLDF